MMSQLFDLDKGQNVAYVNDCSTSGYSSANSPSCNSITQSPSSSPNTVSLQTDFANMNLPNSPIYQHQLLQQPQEQVQRQMLLTIDGICNNAVSIGGVGVTHFGNMYTDHHYYAPQNHEMGLGYGDMGAHVLPLPMEVNVKHEFTAKLHIAEQPVEKFRFRYKSEMHGTHGSLNGATSKRTPRTFPEVELSNYTGPAVIRCSLFQTNLESPHSHQLVVRKDERDVCDPHDVHLNMEDGYVAQFINMGIIHTAKKFIFDELMKKKKERLIFQMGRRELSTKQVQELHQETEREAKDMNLNQVRLCFEAFKIENNVWTPIADPVYSHAINNRKSAQTGELRIVRLSKPTGGVIGNDELILLVEKVSKKNIKVRFFEENEDGETVWEAYAKFRESDVHHQYAIVCQTPPYKDKDVDKDVNVSIELIRPSDDERSFPPLPFRYKPREAIASRKRRRMATDSTSSSGSSTTGSAQSSLEVPRTVQQHANMAMGNTTIHSQTISQEYAQTINEFVDNANLREICANDSHELEKLCLVTDLNSSGILQEDGHSNSPCVYADRYLSEILKQFEAVRTSTDLLRIERARKKVEDLFMEHAHHNDNNDTLLHEVISQKNDNLKLAIKALQVLDSFKLHELANNALNADGNSALHIACQQDRPHYIRPLLRLGCNPNIQNRNGNTALHIAVKEERLICIESFLNGPQVIKLDFSLKNDDGFTPLHMAIRQNKYDFAKKLIMHDRSAINVANTKDGNNSLHMAVLAQNVELLVLILEAKNLTEILKARNAAGYTPLELAHRKGNNRCVQLLEEVYSEKSDLAMTWIPRYVKEEVDSSAEDDDDSIDRMSEIKIEDDIKVEDPEVCETEPEASRKNVQKILNDKIRFSKLATLLNQPSATDSLKPKWKVLASYLQMDDLVFLWSKAEALLGYCTLPRSNCIDYKSFADALYKVDPRAQQIFFSNGASS